MYGAGDEGFALQPGCISDEEAGREIIGPIKNDIVICNQIHDVTGIEALRMHLNNDVRVELSESSTGTLRLGGSYSTFIMQYLPLQIGKVHHVIVDQPETSDSGGGQIEGGGGAQTACPDAQDRAVLQGLLPPPAEGGQGKVALIACLFAVGEHVERDWQGDG